MYPSTHHTWPIHYPNVSLYPPYLNHKLPQCLLIPDPYNTPNISLYPPYLTHTLPQYLPVPTIPDPYTTPMSPYTHHTWTINYPNVSLYPPYLTHTFSQCLPVPTIHYPHVSLSPPYLTHTLSLYPTSLGRHSSTTSADTTSKMAICGNRHFPTPVDLNEAGWYQLIFHSTDVQ